MSYPWRSRDQGRDSPGWVGAQHMPPQTAEQEDSWEGAAMERDREPAWGRHAQRSREESVPRTG